ncbi:thermonuclease family protein (plasmid) [Nostoc sp. UHCC 0926]|uniref:thermonuclease family protein n=1 Tax=Nostoc sp. UHCC 0926 TaxID=3025190 RepID=UPI00235ED0EE|nr:thermonuclease family protein [Nostoc sp. UHCC 0926]WDD36090.1 thermonuclease family protein [Nostoc sp. UHCC 0926]
MKISQLHINKIFISLSLVAIAVSGCNKLHNDVQFGGSNEFTPMSNSEEWQVIRVSDGDTIVVRQMDGREKKLRFCGIDANESKQEGGQEAKAYLKKLLDQTEGRVMITPVDTDRYNRTVAEVFTSLKDGSEQFIQEEMLKAGMARAYPQYISSCPNKDAILKAEQIGKQNRVGIWANPNSIPPWEWRKKERQSRGN